MDTRPPPPQGAPTRFPFVQRMYTRSLRPMVLSIAIMTAIWMFFWVAGAFRAVSYARDNLPSLTKYAYILAFMYLGLFAIELWGVIACILQRVLLIRIYAYGTVVSLLTVTAAGILRIVLHFENKALLIRDCQKDANSGTSWMFSFTGARWHDNFDTNDGLAWCNAAFTSDSWSDILYTLLQIVVGALFVFVCFAYLRQNLDPTSPLNVSRVPVTAPTPSRRFWHNASNSSTATLPQHYNPPYSTEPVFVPTYAPPPGPPPRASEDEGTDSKLPGYQRGVGPDYDDEGRFRTDDKDGGKGGDDPFSDFEVPTLKK